MTASPSSRLAGYWATFAPEERRIQSLPGETLLDCARRAGVRIASICGGRGLCKSCVVRITGGPAGEPSEADVEFFSREELAGNWRRACQTFVDCDCRVEISARAQALPSRTQVESEDVWVHPDPAVRMHRAAIPPPSLAAPVADDRRLIDALNARVAGVASRIDIDVLRRLPAQMRRDDAIVAAVRFGEIIGLMPPRSGPLPGLAVDLGTTNIGATLVDLRTGRTLESRGLENPQSMHGGDVITRIGHACSSSSAQHELRRLAAEAINGLSRAMCQTRALGQEEIADVVIAGNTAMHHLLLGLPVDHLGRVPFVAAASGPADVKARDVGIQAMPGAYVHFLPNIAGFVGGDHTAVLLTIASDRETRTLLVLDIGTNTEISLLHQGRVSSLSCPSGPAFEGGHMRCGMRSAPGAVESVKVRAGDVWIKTIDDAPAIGICGSGVLDIAAQLHVAGIVSPSGRMAEGHPRVRTRDGQREFVLADGAETDGRCVVFTQNDVRAVQLAKSAIRSGIEILLQDAGLRDKDLDQVIIAGAFGNYINVASAVAIGMLPALSMDRFAQIGNAAGIGAKLALVSYPHRAEAQAIASGASYVELASRPAFKTAFISGVGFPLRQQEAPPDVDP